MSRAGAEELIAGLQDLLDQHEGISHDHEAVHAANEFEWRILKNEQWRRWASDSLVWLRANAAHEDCAAFEAIWLNADPDDNGLQSLLEARGFLLALHGSIRRNPDRYMTNLDEGSGGLSRGVSEGAMTITDPSVATSVLRSAIRAVPALKYALGVAGLAAAAAIALGFFASTRVAFVAIIVMFLLMVMVLLFAHLTRIGPAMFRWPLLILVWACVTLSIATPLALFTSVFLRWPLDLSSWIVASDDGAGSGPGGRMLSIHLQEGWTVRQNIVAIVEMEQGTADFTSCRDETFLNRTVTEGRIKASDAAGLVRQLQHRLGGSGPSRGITVVRREGGVYEIACK